MSRRQQLQSFAGLEPCNQCNFAAAQRIVRQTDRRSRADAVNLEPRDPIAQLGRKHQRDFTRRFARVQFQIGRHEATRRTGRVQPMGRNGQRLRLTGACAHNGCQDLAILKPRRLQANRAAKPLENANSAVALERRQKVGTPRIVQPIREPERLKRAFQKVVETRNLVGIWRIWRRRERWQPRPPSCRWLERQLIARRIGQKDHRHAAPCTAGIIQKRFDPLDPLWPVRRIRPCPVKQDQKRSTPSRLGFRVQNRPCKGNDRCRHGQKPQ